jgi:hypothetical protein
MSRERHGSTCGRDAGWWCSISANRSPSDETFSPHLASPDVLPSHHDYSPRFTTCPFVPSRANTSILCKKRRSMLLL